MNPFIPSPVSPLPWKLRFKVYDRGTTASAFMRYPALPIPVSERVVSRTPLTHTASIVCSVFKGFNGST